VLYCLVCRTDAWRSSVHQLFKFGLEGSPAKFESKLTSPLKPASQKRYMVAIHPHSLLCDGWHLSIAKNPGSFEAQNDTVGVPNLKAHLCFSPVIQYVPAHQELYRERCGSATGKTVNRLYSDTAMIPCVCPGGFAEAVYCWSNRKYEYSWLDSNTRFMALAIRNKADIIPSYSYGATSMYYTNPLFRHQLATLAQKWQIPLVLFWGKFLALPLHEDVVTVMYDPFPVEQYTMADVDKALLDYQTYLKKLFDGDKGLYGMADKEMVFIGPKKQEPHSRL